jgi:hypothetical protein
MNPGTLSPEIENVAACGLDDSGDRLLIDFDFKATLAALDHGRFTMLAPVVLPFLPPVPDLDAEKRQHPVLLNSAVRCIDRVAIEWDPQVYRMGALPELQPVKNAAGSVETGYELKAEGKILRKCTIEIPRRDIPKDKLPELSAVCSALESQLEERLILYRR